MKAYEGKDLASHARGHWFESCMSHIDWQRLAKWYLWVVFVCWYSGKSAQKIQSPAVYLTNSPAANESVFGGPDQFPSPQSALGLANLNFSIDSTSDRIGQSICRWMIFYIVLSNSISDWLASPNLTKNPIELKFTSQGSDIRSYL